MNVLLRISALLATASLSSMTYAQQAADEPGVAVAQNTDTLADIVVTAQKRSENVQKVPLAVTALNGDLLQERQVTSISNLATVAPSVNFGTYGGAARIAIRGIGFDTINPGSEARIAYHLDGVYISRPGAQLGTFFDVERVEVLRGPQGTLYGRNATGGSINVISRQPTSTTSGYADLTVGNYGTVAVQAALSGPLTETISARLAVVTNNHSGYGRNEYTGNGIDDANQRGARAMLALQPTSELKITLEGDFYRENDHSYGIHYFGQYNPAMPLRAIQLGGHAASKIRNVNNERDPQNHKELYGFSGTISYDLGLAELKSITAYRHSNYKVETELDQSELALSYFPFFERAHQFSEELQLSGKFGNSNWLIGGYYFDEKIFGGSQVTRNLLVVGGPNLMTNGYRTEGDTHTRALAVFGQLDLAITDELKLIAGARYGHEKIGITDTVQLDFVRPYNPADPVNPLPGFPRTDSISNNAFTPKAGLQYQATPDLLIYATVSKGFKSGGYNLGVNRPAFNPESLWAYEGGVKFTSTDRRIRANLAGFYYDYKNLQVSKVINSSVVTENASDARLYGGEAELTLIPVDRLQIDGSVSYLNSEYIAFSSLDPARPTLGVQNLEGNVLTQAPKWTVNAGAQYQWDVGIGSMTLRGELNHISRAFYTAFNDPAVGQAANTKYNAYLNFVHSNGHWRASLFVRNITDKVTKANALVSSAVYNSPITGSVSPPRTFGLQINYKL